jgi:hypothetical protein
MRLPAPVVERGMALARRDRDRGRADIHRACRQQVARLQAQLAVTAAAQAVDDHLFGDWKHVDVREPVFIAAPPRSGTTLLFNLMARDPAFTCMKTYQSQLPAVSLWKLVHLLGRLDRGPLDGRARRLVDRLDRRTAGFEHVHRTRLLEPEEDSGLFLSALVEPNINLVFPFGHDLDDRWYLDDFDAWERTEVMRWYADSLKRHLYDQPGRLLVKNAHLAGRLESVRETFPDLRVINIVRHPYQTVPSSISLVVNGYRTLTGIRPDPTSPEFRAIADATIEYYLRLRRLEKTFPHDQWVTIRFDDLVTDPAGTVRAVYDHLGLPWSPQAAAGVDDEAARSDRHRSASHGYTMDEFGLSPADVHEPLTEIFDAYGFER